MSAAARAALIALALLAPFGNAQAQSPAAQPSEAAKAMVRSWEFSNADRDRVCTVTFRAEAVAAGSRVDFDRQCLALYPFLSEVVAWRMAENDFLRLVNASGDNVLEFSEVESGVFEAPRPGEGILFIQNAGAAGPAPREPDQVAGDYQVTRSNKTVCNLTLLTTPTGADRALKTATPCEATWTRFAPITWALERDELLVKNARGQVWRFEESDPNVWRRVPQGDGATLVRK